MSNRRKLSIIERHYKTLELSILPGGSLHRRIRAPG